MKLILIILALLMVVMVTGCTQVRVWTLDSAKEDMANAVISREAADILMASWSLNSGAMQCGLRDYLPPPMLQKILSIDDVVKRSNKWSDVDYNRGCFLGKRGELAVDQAWALIQKMIGIFGQFIK